ncbi:Borrelia lipoprotein-containing protein (plasmid) [Borrelia crocidurae str. Achema]|uniref:Variable large protein n=1 Tax=Borrelia crocidurae (strain Achema) TaxID=1155096 RepID=I0FFB0_BORCA|nr:Borrelia lipoprotein-containing protein [Borrelia crocidurae str. Achema]
MVSKKEGGEIRKGREIGRIREVIIKGIATSAVTKALDTLTIAIRKTIDLGFKKVKETIKINANDSHVF